jgi:hypothetical protein
MGKMLWLCLCGSLLATGLLLLLQRHVGAPYINHTSFFITSPASKDSEQDDHRKLLLNTVFFKNTPTPLDDPTKIKKKGGRQRRDNPPPRGTAAAGPVTGRSQ